MAIKLFKAIQGHRSKYQSKARWAYMRLPVSDRHPISYRFEVIANYCSKIVTLRFLAPSPLGSIRAAYTVHFRLIGKLVVDFLFVLIELFFTRCYGRGAMSEYWLEIDVYEGGGVGQHWPKFSRRRESTPRIIFARIDRPVNALQLCRWQCLCEKNFVADFFQVKCTFWRKTAILRFKPPWWN